MTKNNTTGSLSGIRKGFIFYFNSLLQIEINFKAIQMMSYCLAIGFILNSIGVLCVFTDYKNS